MRIFLAAGGTGGHIIPALAVAEALKARGVEVIFLGVGKELERKLIGSNGYRLEEIPFPAIYGKGLGGIIKALMSFPSSYWKARTLFAQEAPDAVLAFGGYPSFIPIFTALLQGVPRAIHEQNVKVGLANKILALFSRRVFAVPGAHGFFPASKRKLEAVPNPVRSVFYTCPSWEAPQRGEPFSILVLGGSQGARKVNDAVMASAEILSKLNVKLVHQTGQADWERVRDFYQSSQLGFARAVPFLDNVVENFKAAHLVISRAGAMSVAEVLACGRPAIFIPLSIAGGHQADNVQLMLKAEACLMLEQNDALPTELAKLVHALIPDHARLARMASAAQSLARQGTETSAGFLAEQMIALAKNRASVESSSNNGEQ